MSIKLNRYALFTVNFFGIYSLLSEEQLDDLISKIKDILDNEENITAMEMKLLEDDNIPAYLEFSTKKMSLLKSIARYAEDHYGVILRITGTLPRSTEYINAPIVPLEEINETFKIDNQNF